MFNNFSHHLMKPYGNYSRFEEVRDDLEYARNMTDYIWSEFDYIESMNDTVDKIYADMNVIVQFLEDGDEIYNHMNNMSEMIHEMNNSALKCLMISIICMLT